ncbi:hypothetical protein BSKO_07142 [Bryopsis sp. KO-2023]|nr:hypothetical protein BSKO_07142 [Bryopsis sp. KO-2023]
MLRAFGCKLLGRSGVSQGIRLCSATAQELEITGKIRSGIEGCKSVEVKDTSGGCGTMFTIDIVSDQFSNKSTVQQHQLVAKILKEDIPKWHGFTLNTKAP